MDEKSKRIRRWRILRIPLIVLSGIFLVLVSLAFWGLVGCCYDPNLTSEIELTATYIIQMNATTRVQITQTADAIPPSLEDSDAESTFLYLDQNHTPFALPETPTHASPFPTNPVVPTSTP